MSQHCPGCDGEMENEEGDFIQCPGCGHEAELTALRAVAVAAKLVCATPSQWTGTLRAVSYTHLTLPTNREV